MLENEREALRASLEHALREVENGEEAFDELYPNGLWRTVQPGLVNQLKYHLNRMAARDADFHSRLAEAQHWIGMYDSLVPLTAGGEPNAAALAEAMISAEDGSPSRLLDVLQTAVWHAHTLASRALSIYDEETAKQAAIEHPPPEAQVPAPFQFEIDGGRLRVRVQEAVFDAQDENNIRAARDVLVEQCESLCGELEGTNHRRLLSALNALYAHLKNQQNIIQLGMMNDSLRGVIVELRDELPADLYGLALGHSRGISGYLAQFSEWRRFNENIIDAGVSGDDLKSLVELCNTLSERFGPTTEIADPGVAAAFKQAADWVDVPAPSARQKWSLVTSLQNLALLLAKGARSFIKGTAKSVFGVLQAAAAVAIVYAMVAHLPALEKMPGGEWIVPAVLVLNRYVTDQTKQ